MSLNDEQPFIKGFAADMTYEERLAGATNARWCIDGQCRMNRKLLSLLTTMKLLS